MIDMNKYNLSRATTVQNGSKNLYTSTNISYTYYILTENIANDDDNYNKHHIKNCAPQKPTKKNSLKIEKNGIKQNRMKPNK